jgi:pilus assembly protein CpaF
LHVIVQLARLTDGSRKLIELAEVTGMEGSVITTQMIFRFDQRTVENGKVIGDFVATGVRPLFLERLEHYGQKIPHSYFMPSAARQRA